MNRSENSIQLKTWLFVAIGIALAALFVIRGLFEPRRPNVLLVTIDTLRADHLGCYGYSKPVSPTLDRLAEKGVRFEYATVPRALTWPSLNSLWTGLYPLSHGVRDGMQSMNPDIITLGRIFSENGYQTGAFVTNFFPERYGFEVFENSFRQGKYQAEWDEKATERALAWLRERSGGPFFCWVHYIGPHTPYDPRPAYASRFAPGAFKYSGTIDELKSITIHREALSDEQLQHLIDRYDAQIAEVDNQVARLVDWLEEEGDWENTLLVLTADHGEELFEHHHYFAHAGSIYEGSLRIPLIVVQPKRFEAGQVRRELVEILDLFPTLLDGASLRTPHTNQLLSQSPVPPGGQSLLPLLEAPAPAGSAIAPQWDRYTFSELSVGDKTLFAVRNREWKMILNPEQAEVRPYRDTFYTTARRELYRLGEDPKEQNNVIDQHPQVTKRMEKAFEQWLEACDALPVEELGADALEAMKAMGYFQ